MIINSLKLKNIRSYRDEDIIFPEGTIMLSGDVGSGKTTILIAIEFALFGIIRGQLSGTSLLRHGQREGFVEMEFKLSNQKITIKRTLKRSNNSVTQSSGYMVISGVKQDLTPVELKAKILELIGYPEELLTKSKSLIYRYTVYTPQEEMKQILYESKDDRLNVIRIIFDIDKYERVKNNTIIYLKELRTKKTTLETRIEDLDDKRKELSEYNDKIKVLKEEIHKEQQQLEIVNKELKEKEEVMKQFEEQIKAISELKRQAEIKTYELNTSKRELDNNKSDVEDIDFQIKKLTTELEGKGFVDVETLKKLKQELEAKINVVEENIEKISDREATFKAKTDNSKQIINKITSLDECPVCQQKVDEMHKHSVKTRENKIVTDLEQQLSKLALLKDKRKQELLRLKEQMSKIEETIRADELIKLKQEQLKESKSKKEKLLVNQSEFSKQITSVENLIIELKKKQELQSGVEDKHSKAKELVDEVLERQQSNKITIAELKREEQTLSEVKGRLSEEIAKKEESKKELAKVNETREWMLKYFMNIIYLMEKQMLMRIHREFNEYFQEWFNIMIEDENLNVRLDETFTPMIEQNGYETMIENLSGGEKTSVALAYRLALNKVINDFIGTIKTKDLLILDEPTDGFSSEQQDKIRELLESLMVKQIILVSHEPKLESYVEHIIRVVKEEHVSKVII